MTTMLNWNLRYNLSHFKGSSLNVLISIMLHCNWHFRAWPTNAKMKKETGRESQAVSKAIEHLVSINAIALVPEEHRSGKQENKLSRRKNIYQLTGFLQDGDDVYPYFVFDSMPPEQIESLVTALEELDADRYGLIIKRLKIKYLKIKHKDSTEVQGGKRKDSAAKKATGENPPTETITANGLCDCGGGSYTLKGMTWVCNYCGGGKPLPGKATGESPTTENRKTNRTDFGACPATDCIHYDVGQGYHCKLTGLVCSYAPTEDETANGGDECIHNFEDYGKGSVCLFCGVAESIDCKDCMHTYADYIDGVFACCGCGEPIDRKPAPGHTPPYNTGTTAVTDCAVGCQQYRDGDQEHFCDVSCGKPPQLDEKYCPHCADHMPFTQDADGLWWCHCGEPLEVDAQTTVATRNDSDGIVEVGVILSPTGGAAMQFTLTNPDKPECSEPEQSLPDSQRHIIRNGETGVLKVITKPRLEAAEPEWWTKRHAGILRSAERYGFVEPSRRVALDYQKCAQLKEHGYLELARWKNGNVKPGEKLALTDKGRAMLQSKSVMDLDAAAQETVEQTADMKTYDEIHKPKKDAYDKKAQSAKKKPHFDVSLQHPHHVEQYKIICKLFELDFEVCNTNALKIAKGYANPDDILIVYAFQESQEWAKKNGGVTINSMNVSPKGGKPDVLTNARRWHKQQAQVNDNFDTMVDFKPDTGSTPAG